MSELEGPGRHAVSCRSAPYIVGVPWDTAARDAIGRYMGQVTNRTWVSHKTGLMAGFGGCLAVVFLWPLVFAYLGLKITAWAFIEVVFLVAWLCVTLAGGCWRGYRVLRHNPVGQVQR